MSGNKAETVMDIAAKWDISQSLHKCDWKNSKPGYKFPENMGDTVLAKIACDKPISDVMSRNMMNHEVETVEDALTMLQATVFEPDHAAPLIRKNLDHGLSSVYEVQFFKSANGICVTAKVTPSYKSKYLGKHDGLE